ncbi:MAG: hypothetical protein J1F39_03065 [Clostridiales bacterium]|nr:hypothetical protein [Clostridiales bacterium]
MKTTAKLKKFGLTMLLALVGIALVFSCFSFRAPFVASAEEEDKNLTPASASLFEGLNVPKECDYGATFTVPKSKESGVTVKVTAPNGDEVGEESGDNYNVKALQVGNYKVTYVAESGDYENGAEKSFFVKVTLNKEFFLKVDYDGASIPTYIKTGGKFTLPEANVVYYDENGMLRSYAPAEDVKIEIYDSDHPEKVYAPGDEFEAYKNGKIYVTYSAKVGGTNGLKYFNKVFTVNSQATLSESNSAPTLSISGVTSDISINRPVTLPKATASDSYDENVQIDITVKYENGDDVKYVKIDRNGYAYEEEEDAVIFDNDKSMTFYPVKTGDYTVTYTATNDAGKTSSPRVYHMTCKDLVAPVFKETYDYNIPETWGLTVKKLGENGEDEEAIEDLGGKITFYVPEVVDNKDHAYATDEEDTDLISLYFRITDADNSRTIISFDNILADDDSDSCKFQGNSTYGEKEGEESSTYKKEIFNKDHPFVFDFTKYNKTDAKGEVVERPGTYTVYFRARDKAQNTSSKTYTIKLEEEFVDTAAPSSAEVTVPSHISATDKTLTIPSPVVADAKDSRPNVEYKLYTDNGTEDNYITVDGGEIADLETVDGKIHLVINKDKEDAKGKYEKRLVLGDTIYFYVKVTDKVGNVKVNTEDGKDITDDPEAYKKVESKIFILSPNSTHSFTLDADDIDFGAEKIEAGKSINVGDFKVTTSNGDSVDDMRPYVGFEIAVLDPKGSALSVSLQTVSAYVNDVATVYVKNVTFKPTVAGEHSMVITAFDVNGKTSAKGYKFNVVKSTTGGTTTSAAVISNSGDVNVTYTLHNEKIDVKNGNPDKTYFVIRKITGYSFALMGNEFTAKTQATYRFKDTYIEYDEGNAEFDITDEEFEDLCKKNDFVSSYSFSASDTSVPVIEVQGYMPTYAKVSTTEEKSIVTLPSVIAYTQNGVAEVELKITDPNGTPVKPTKSEEGNTNTFEAKVNGVYTVVYTATAKSAQSASATYSINVGDVTGPEFTVTGGSSGRFVVGDKFTFGKMKIEDEEEKGLKITKKLIDPSKNEVSSATVNGSYSTYKDYANNGTEITFSMAGQYEIVYEAEDAYGNKTTQRYNVTVVSSGSGTPTTITTLSTVLIIVAVVLLAGVIIYVVRFRKVKEKKN